MTNEKLIKNLCENELEKVSGGYGLGDYAKEHPFLTFFGATNFVAAVVSTVVGIAALVKLSNSSN